MRCLRPDEIECRVNIINEKGLSLLLYKNARTDMAILDELYPLAWECEYKEIKGNLFCGISVYTEKGKLTRWDCGVESREDGNGNEKKGEASDSFKRACTKWGIGRELYTAPKLIWVRAGDFSIYDNKGKKATYDTFSVIEIFYTEGNITALKIKNDKTGKIVYSFCRKQQEQQVRAEEKKKIDEEEYLKLKIALVEYIEAGFFEHPENVERVIRDKNIVQMRIALKTAKEKESENNK